MAQRVAEGEYNESRFVQQHLTKQVKFAVVARLIVFLIFASLVFFLCSTVSMIFRQIGRWNHVIRQLAERYGGYARPGGAFSNPGMQFSYGDHYCHLRYRKGNFRRTRVHVTEFATHWPNRNLQMRLISNQFPQKPKSYKRLVNVDVGDENFSEKYRLLANPASAAKTLINEGSRWQVEQLAQHCGDGNIKIVISGGLLLITKPGYIREPTSVDDFLRLSLALLDQFNLTLSEGIEFEQEDSAKLLEAVFCPICSEEILDQMVVCVRCKTPHCQDCWEYNGQCATFACGEERFLTTSVEANSSSS